MKYILSIAIGILLSIWCTGCGGTKLNITKLEPLQNKIVKYPTVNVVNGEPLVVNPQVIMSLSNIQKISQYESLKKANTFSGGGIEYKGIETNYKNNILKLSYIEKIAFGNSKKYGSVVYDIKYIIKGNEITYFFPKTYTENVDISFLGVECGAPYPIADIEKDAKKIFNNLDKLAYTNSYKLKGEVNSKYSKKSVYANFKRILTEKRYSWSKGNTNEFIMKINNNAIVLKTKFSPYRDGVKIEYSALIEYSIYPDGTSTLTKEDIDKAVKTIEKIVND